MENADRFLFSGFSAVNDIVSAFTFRFEEPGKALCSPYPQLNFMGLNHYLVQNKLHKDEYISIDLDIRDTAHQYIRYRIAPAGIAVISVFKGEWPEPWGVLAITPKKVNNLKPALVKVTLVDFQKELDLAKEALHTAISIHETTGQHTVKIEMKQLLNVN